MMGTSPLILVQFLKDSMLEALMAMVLIRAPTPTPLQAGGREKLRQVGGSGFRSGSAVSVYLWDRVRHILCSAGRRFPPPRRTRRRRCGHTPPQPPRSYLKAIRGDGSGPYPQCNWSQNIFKHK